jgi:hypothetical protein
MTTRETCDLLRQNGKVPVLQLWLDKGSDRIGITEALKLNGTVNTVSIFIEDDIAEAPIHELSDLFKAIGSLPALQFVYIYSFGQNYDILPFSLLACILEEAQLLEIITLYFVELGGNKSECDRFQESIRYHPSLREFRLESCRLSEEGISANSMREFMETLASMPNIEKVDLIATEMGYLGDASKESVKALCKTNTLSALSLINFSLSSEHIAAIRHGLEAPPYAPKSKLTELSISCDPKEASNIYSLLDSNNNSLERLRLRLKTLDDDESIEKLGDSLVKNKSIKRFHLLGELKNRLSRKSQQTFASMLEQNSVLEHLDVGISDEDLRSKIKFYLKLNQTGLRELMHSPEATRPQLVGALIEVKNDLDCLVHFLGSRPCLCKD